MNYKKLQKKYHAWFTKTKPAPALITYILIFIFILSRLNYKHFNILYIITGWINWTLMEYLLHRFLFHFKTRDRHLKFLRYLLHDVHHQSPGNTLFIPLIVRWLVLLQTGFIWQSLAGIQGYWFFAGYACGMMYYMLIHWALHLPATPAFLQALKKHHLYHHLNNPHVAFGVTTTFWDWLFNTLPPAKETMLSPQQHNFYYTKS